MVIGIVAALILAASIIGIPSIVTTLLLQFIFDLEPLATFLVLLCIVPLMATLMLIGIIWLVISLARLLGFAVAQTWPRNITLSAISLLSAFLSGLTLAKIGSVVIVHYALNPIIGSAIYLIAVILYMIAAGLAIGQVMETKNKKWTYSIIVIVFACLVIVGTVNIYRNDNYDPKTGKSIVYITPSTGKLWRNKPVGFNFDPANGEKLVLVTPEMLAKAASKPPSATPAIASINGKMLSIELKPNQVYDVDDLKAGQNFRYLSFNGSFSHRVDKGDGQACWGLIDNNLPFSADYAGKLQVRAGNTPVKLTVNIKRSILFERRR